MEFSKARMEIPTLQSYNVMRLCLSLLAFGLQQFIENTLNLLIASFANGMRLRFDLNI